LFILGGKRGLLFFGGVYLYLRARGYRSHHSKGRKDLSSRRV